MAIVIEPISPVAFSLFGLDVRWYALAYVAAFVVGYFLFRHLISEKDSGISLTKKQMDDFFTTIIFSVILGGRLGYVLFYNLPFFLRHPLEILAVWHGGMSFHGGLLGVIIGTVLFARAVDRSRDARARQGTFRTAFRLLDMVAVVAPIGLFFGRIANFINMEVMGRPTTRPWGVVFAGDNALPRHASPLYEAAAEGLVLFALMYGLCRWTRLRTHPGALSGVLGMGYAVARIFCEQFRAPDAQIGFLTSWGLTMGQLLSGVMFLGGAIIFAIAFRKK